MKTAQIDITVTAKVNGSDIPCELSSTSKIIIEGDLIVQGVSIDVEKETK